MTIHTKGFDRSDHRSAGRRMAMQMINPTHGRRAGLLLVLLGAFFADVLTDLELAQLLDDIGPTNKAMSSAVSVANG